MTFLKTRYSIQLAVFFLFVVIAEFSWSGELPIDDFVKHGDYLELTISPDGQHLAARLRHEGTAFVIVLRVSNLEVVGGARPSTNNEIHSVTWVNNERLVYESAQKVAGLEAPIPTGELFGVNLDGSRRKTLYGFRAGDSRIGTRVSAKDDSYATQEILSVLPNDEKHILIIEYPWSLVRGSWYDNRSKQPSISKLNVYTGRKTHVEVLPHNGAKAIASTNGTVNFMSWHSEDSEFHAAYREGGEGEWQPLDVSFSEYTPRPVAVNAATTKAYFLIPYGERRIDTLYELEFATGEVTQLFDDLNAPIDAWVSDPVSLEPVVGVSEFDRSRYHYVSDSSSEFIRTHKMLVRSFKGKDVSITSWSRDGKFAVFRLQGDTDPGEFHILNTETRQAEFVWANRSWIDPRTMRPMQHLEFQAEDGVVFYGYLTLPELDEGDPKPPLLVVLHGGPHGSRDYWQYNSEIQLFANRGYAVLQVNFRGSGGYGKDFEESGYREWGGKMIGDIVAATEQVTAAGTVDPERVCVFGASYGGYAALMSVVRAPTLYRCAIGYAGIYDLRHMYTKGDIPDLWGGEGYLERVLGRDEDVLAEFSPVTHVGKIDAAVMLIHGTQDRRAPVDHARAMRKKLEQAGKDVTWQLHGRSEHGVYSAESAREMYEGILEFLNTNIGPQGP